MASTTSWSAGRGILPVLPARVPDRDAERRTLAQLAAHRQSRPGQVGQPPRERQADAAAGGGALLRAQALERLEQVAHAVGVDARTGVGDGDLDLVPGPRGGDLDLLAAVLDRVREQVQEDLGEPPAR